MLNLDGRHVLFGKVVSGMDVVFAIESHGSKTGVPTADIVIVGCGEIVSDEEAFVRHSEF
jgi:cyclophilin family peptidyl-prolyl cis-trans isomerase